MDIGLKRRLHIIDELVIFSLEQLNKRLDECVQNNYEPELFKSFEKYKDSVIRQIADI